MILSFCMVRVRVVVVYRQFQQYRDYWTYCGRKSQTNITNWMILTILTSFTSVWISAIFQQYRDYQTEFRRKVHPMKILTFLTGVWNSILRFAGYPNLPPKPTYLMFLTKRKTNLVSGFVSVKHLSLTE